MRTVAFYSQVVARQQFRLASLGLMARISQPSRFICRSATTAAGCHIANRRAFKGTHAAALSTFAFSARTHAILLIVSGSFVLETSSSCGLVVPMRALPRPMGRHRVPLIFAVDVVVVCPPPSCRGDACARKRRNASEAMTQLRKCYRYYLSPLSPCPVPHATVLRRAR